MILVSHMSGFGLVFLLMLFLSLEFLEFEERGLLGL